MIKHFYFILLSLLVSCSSTGIKLVDEYYIYPPDEYYNSLKFPTLVYRAFLSP